MGIEIDQHMLARMNLEASEEPGRHSIVYPDVTNMAADTVGRHAAGDNADHVAMVFETADGGLLKWTFRQIDDKATRLAAHLQASGIGVGDRVAIHTGLRPETGIAHMAVYKLGAIAVTLSQLYGPDTVHHVLNHSGASAIITQDQAWARYRSDVSATFPSLREVIVVGDAAAGETCFDSATAVDPSGFVDAATRADDPALLLYTSGSTGMPKGILHGHRILQAYKPSIHLFFNLDLEQPDAVYWSPADWAWVGGLLDLLLPAWMAGRPVVTSEQRFDAEWAFGFMARHRVTHTFLTPTALKRLAEIPDAAKRWDFSLRVICTGGEALPGEVLRWVEEDLGVTCNEFYGLTEVNHLIGCCKALYPARPGSMGRAYPGHGTTIVDQNGNELPDGEVGEIVTRADDPTRFLGYWRDEVKTEDLHLGPWLRTRDLAARDADGYFWYKGRTDDLIKSAGYRIGPAEVEDSLVKHPAVAEAAVVGSPDPDRGAVVKAFIRLAIGFTPSAALTSELQGHVKHNLAAYKYPREVEYVESFEMTSTGKINRRALREREQQKKRA